MFFQKLVCCYCVHLKPVTFQHVSAVFRKIIFLLLNGDVQLSRLSGMFSYVIHVREK